MIRRPPRSTLDRSSAASDVYKRQPQGSVLGPLLFILYTAGIPSLFPNHSAIGHLFADDVQAYVCGPPSAQLLLASHIDALSQDLHLWMSSNRLSLNSSKTQLIWFGTPQQLLKLDYNLLSEKFPHFTFSSLSLIHISEPTRLLSISYAVFCLKK